VHQVALVVEAMAVTVPLVEQELLVKALLVGQALMLEVEAVVLVQ
jgi:hypothetical protein